MNNQALIPFIEKYLAQRPPFFSLIRPQEAFLFQKYKKNIQSPSLDFGCGDGFFAQSAFGEKNIDIGLDVYQSRIREAKHIYKITQVYTGHHIPYSDQSIHTVVSNCVFEHLPHIQDAIAEIYRVLKPQGYLLTSVMTQQWDRHLAGSRLLGSAYIEWMHRRQIHINLFSLTQWKYLFIKQGFHIQDIVGYISPHNAMMLDLAHYVSIPSLIRHAITKKWSMMPSPLLQKKCAQFIAKHIEMNTPLPTSSGLFFVLQKK